MSILIKNMEMPTTCRDCRLSTFTDFDSMPFCNITMDDICLNDWETKRCDNCPLVPVPPHGRLIDETWLNMQIHTAKEIHENEKHDFCNAFDSNGHICTEWWCVEDMIENAPTIIPADKEGE